MNEKLILRPIFIDDIKKVNSFLKKNKYVTFIDAFSHQLKELVFIKNHQLIGEDKEDTFKSKFFKEFVQKNNDNFTHVYFPWNHTLTKIIKKADYLVLKTNRNRDLITEEEQKKLSNYRIGVFGMSVGSNIAFVLTQAGISNEITIADFDNLDTTNLNRILAGVHQVGLNKTIIASRRIYEDNPFAKVNLFPKGINSKDLESLLKNKKLDCIVEEIDDIAMKIETRFLAIKYKIPVVMITDNGDGVVLHIERYDLGYKNIFNKPVSYWSKLKINKPTKEQAGNIIMNDIVGGIDKVDPRMIKSVKKVLNKELVSWSQLGSAAIFGGVITTFVIKEIIRNNKKPYLVKYFNLSI
jgi:hypothetical protein